LALGSIDPVTGCHGVTVSWRSVEIYGMLFGRLEYGCP